MACIPPNINPRISTLSAIIIGFALLDDFTANEQIAIANWFLALGQTMVTNGSFQRVIEERIAGNIININSDAYKKGGSPYVNPQSESNLNHFFKNMNQDFANWDLEYIKVTLQKINEEIDKLKAMYKQ